MREIFRLFSGHGSLIKLVNRLSARHWTNKSWRSKSGVDHRGQPFTQATLRSLLTNSIYAGKVDHGFDKQSSAELRKRLTPLIRKTQPYTKRIAHKGIWVEPELLTEIEYRAQSAEGKVRHPFFRGPVRTYRWTISIASGNGQISRLAAGPRSRR